ncbi:UDP-xylose and UDP-N-acetylglucosamine transporter [Zootermopsis nevadensis]|uniref:UDP-xylose and UDP-N-acetylglucosamine transporter-like n=1 Tax=Zootermopsis nevadensis TaxID=136037 RepID=A0A067R3Y0_ZOONE|nr:UDP-xylose and UDP-N-acetylglucosamine transporter [Zootermopsis nevadensis]KDR17872.1 UDP-xylose and UDP-N-acetylglucosamine transporter-like [Zootermopsis nevadensis]
MKSAIAIVMVFVGCCSNVVFLELLVKEDPSSGNIITFSQFFIIALEGFIITAHFGTKKPSIGIKDYAVLVAMFFCANVCNNYAFNFNIPMPLHMIFRAGSLIANMIMGILILNKEYTSSKYLSVFMITLGISVCTIVSGKDMKATTPLNQIVPEQSEMDVLFWWIVGILLLTVALFVSARMGIYQEELYKRYGKHPRESLYYTHLLPLPGFLILYENIYSHIISFAQSEPVAVPVIGVGLPKLYLYLAGNVLTQCVCINSVYVLTTECTSLTVTLVVTLRKFISLLFSIVYFKNEFTFAHWLGTFLVFSGTLIFTEVVDKFRAAISSPLPKKVE